MNLTNNQNLPEPIFNAIVKQQEKYAASHDRPSDISATSLIDSPQVVELRRKHAEEMNEDASDMIWSLLGSTVHDILESATDSAHAENRLYAEYEGWTVSGQYDYFKDGFLADYKICSVWEAMDGLKASRAEQLNVLKRLLNHNGETVNELAVVSIYRDWSRPRAEREENYPKQQVQVHPVAMWDDEYTDEFISSRIKAHQAVRSGGEGFCSAEDRWARPDVWAVMKAGRKRALKLHDNEASANQHANVVDGYVEFREGESVRCQMYCSVSDRCPQFKEMSNH